MAKTKVSEFDAVASNNTDINSVNVAEGCPPSGINNAIREMASLLKKQEVGTDAMTSPDIDGGTIDGATIGGSSGVTIGVSDGTVSAPSIKFTGDTNTGIYRGGTDILKFVTAGTDAITIDASQNVTIGNNLSITGNGSTSDLTGSNIFRIMGDDVRITNSAGSEAMATSTADGAVTLYHDANPKLATTATGINVTGTATMDGLTVDGDAVIASTVPRLILSETDVTDGNWDFRGSFGNLTIRSLDDDLSTASTKLGVGANGDISFYEDTGTTPKFYWDASEERLGIGNSSPTNILEISANATNNGMLINNTSTGNPARITLTNSEGSGYIDQNNNLLRFAQSGSTDVAIDSSGNFMVSTTENTLYDDTSGSGLCYRPNLSLDIARQASVPSHYMLSLNNTGVDAKFINFAKDGTGVGVIAVASVGGALAMGIGHSDSGLYFDNVNNCVSPFNINTNNINDDFVSLGVGSARFDNVFATNGTIQTSDRNEKQDIEELSDAEQRVAVVAKGLMRKYRWKSAVAEKGDNARTHFGIIAQDLQDAFTAESLDANKYAMFCSDTWWEKEISVDAVEADEENDIEAKDAYTYIDTKDEATEGYTEKTRLGVRYNQLLAFIISAI